MTPRPVLATKKRPSSAIYVGSASSTETKLPDLPDPPSSPHSSSGLPSPPATNSTGSGSNGGDNCTRFGSIRIPSRSDLKSDMRNGSSSSSSGPRSSSRASSDEADEGNDEDHTAKLSDDRRAALKNSTKENQTPLQRVKSLTQRNQMVLSKLASITSSSRLSTPSPNGLARNSRSPAPCSSAASSSSSRLSTQNLRRERSASLSKASGSETERENFPTRTTSPDDFTPPSASFIPARPESVRERRVSAPDSPRKGVLPLPERDRSVRPSEASTIGRRILRPESRASGDIASAALAAIANSRRRSPSDARKRQPLPREFRTERSSTDGKALPEPPSTPRRAGSDRTSPNVFFGRGSPSQASRTATTGDSPQSPRVKAQRFSTVREITRRHQTRWLSQDLTPPSKDDMDENGVRRQSRRGGSTDSPLSGVVSGRSVVGEGLRAAGLTKQREDTDDVFGGDETQASRRNRLSSDLGSSRPLRERTETVRPLTRQSDRPVTTEGLQYGDLRTPINSNHNYFQRNAHTIGHTRPSTSMSAYHEEPRTAPLLRTNRSEAESGRVFAADSSRPVSQAGLHFPISSLAAQDRASPATFGRRAGENVQNVPKVNNENPEHVRLMLDTLNMFESNLARLPSMGSTTTVTIPDLFRSAQNIVHSANALNILLRSGTDRALAQQVEAEVADSRSTNVSDIWRDVGSDYRESLRVSDELVRTMTSFLSGVGRLLRESSAERSHLRTGSLDETSSTRRLTPDYSLGNGRTSEGRLSSDGRSSNDAKKRWDSSSGEMGMATTSYTSVHSSSSASQQSSSSQHLSSTYKPRIEGDRRVNGLETPNEHMLRKVSRLSLTTPRRLDSFLDYQDSQPKTAAPVMQLSHSESSALDMDSPLAAATLNRAQGTGPRRATSLAVAPSLPTLPSESIIAKRDSIRINRRPKTSSLSNATVRANSIFPSMMASGNPTTAITPMAVQASPERPSLSSTRSTFNVRGTLSKTTGAAVAELQEQIERDGRKRTISASSALENEVPPFLSGSETERERPRMSLDSNPGYSGTRTSSYATGSIRERRGTVTGLFSRN